jgi:hypothetical protein
MQKRGWDPRNKKGQVTIFIIIAIVIVGIVVLVYMLIPKAETGTGFDPGNPIAFIQNCLQNDLERNVDIISSQGGSLDPELYFMYLGSSVEYLCYTNEFYKTCVVQQPLLKQHVEAEIEESISQEVSSCFNNLEENYRAEGYTVTLNSGRTKVELLPKRVVVNFEDYILTVTKDGTAMYDAFSIVLNNNLYELTSIANSIIDWEAAYGDAETTIYMAYYKDLKVEKRTQPDGTKIYILTDRNNGRIFRFASRSVAWPPGFSS